ncbi:TonB-dependent receptor [Stenotrophomonas sp. SI-NJAU-1]|uniref:TonB-dependent receptor plug domain-containing protein n=1 Tax=Stenotrophomonas sp. SI-NJAU-1 TaxID=2886359 RepID=UPI001E2CC99A|nr:TonB-dependent receptor [Stenotrophomonas sp. SI-NJAU-1]UEX18024.1 TonB-dependent receptor [Stenotrophomonas sp. SI-NJAU-1]
MFVPSSSRLVVALLFTTGPVSAQTAADNKGASHATELSAVTVQSSRYDSRRDSTASRIVVDSDELGRHGDTTLVDALKRLPGITVGTPAPGRSGAIALRGMGAGYTQILVDGQQPPAGFDIDSLTPDMIERVEILRSATADQRAEAIAGTINIVLAGTQRKDTDKVSLVWAATANGRQAPAITWQRNRHRDAGSHALVATASRRAFLVEETGQEHGTDSDDEEQLSRTTKLRAEGSREVLTFAPTIEVHVDDDNTLRLQGNAEASRFTRVTDIEWNTLQGPALQHSRYRQNTDIAVALLQGNARWSRQSVNGGRFDAKIGLGGNRERNTYREHGQDVIGQPSLEERTDRELRVSGVSSTGSYALPASGRHNLQMGWEGSLDRHREDRTQSIRYFGLEPDTYSNQAYDAQVRRLAFYLQDELTFGPQWSLYLGTRWERIETVSDGGDFVAIRNRRQVLSPVLQSLWKLPGKNGDNGDRIRLALSRTFKAPALTSLLPRPYTSTNNRPANPDEIGNPALRPELATGIDLAYEIGSGQGLRLNLGGYFRQIKGVVRKELQYQNGRWLIAPVNGGNAAAWGLELDGGLPLSALFRTAPAIDLRFNATRAWSRVDDVPAPDNRIPDQTRFSATLGADYRINPRWSGGISYSYRSSVDVRTTSVQMDLKSPNRELDLHAQWTATAKTRLRFSASNLLQQELVSGQRYLLPEGSQEIVRTRRGIALFRAELEIQL